MNELNSIELVDTLDEIRKEMHITNLLKIIELFEIDDKYNYEQTVTIADDIYRQMTTRLEQDGGF